VIPLDERGKLPDLIPLFKGHSAPVLDTDFNPFNDSLLASASEDGKVYLSQTLLTCRFASGLCLKISPSWIKRRQMCLLSLA
jgi:WD40 repeat protein